MDQVIFVYRVKICLSRPYLYKFSIGCFQEILLCLFLNTLSQVTYHIPLGSVFHQIFRQMFHNTLKCLQKCCGFLGNSLVVVF